MNKKIINDIIVSKKSIRQIPVSVNKTPRAEKVTNKVREDDEQIKFKHKDIAEANWQRKPMNPKFIIWLIAGICVLALFFGISIIFSSATVIISPKIQNITFNNDTYTAKLISASTTDISFEVLTVKQSLGEAVEAGEEKEVSQKATGKIIIYNNYSSAPQRLINNTRFEANNGKIYRINSSIIVPGTTKVAGKTLPGSIEATVFADQPGEAFNLKLSDLAGDFKIPGFKGDIRYQSFYARLKDDIVGGFIGKQRVVAENLRKETEEIIKAKLKEQLLKELYAVKPENYIIFKDAYNIDYKNLPDTAVDSNMAKINIEGTINGIVFNNLKLSKYFSNKKITGFDNLPTEIIPDEDLTVNFTGADTTGLWKNKILSLKINGNAIIKWTYDAETIKKDLAGKKESDLKGLSSRYRASVSSIKVVFRPVWTRYFPDNINKIKVIEEII